MRSEVHLSESCGVHKLQSKPRSNLACRQRWCSRCNCSSTLGFPVITSHPPIPITPPSLPLLAAPSCPPARARQSLKVLLHAKGEPVTMPYTNVHGQQYGRQYAWQLLAGLSQYDKKTASYLPIRTMRLQVRGCRAAAGT